MHRLPSRRLVAPLLVLILATLAPAPPAGAEELEPVGEQITLAPTLDLAQSATRVTAIPSGGFGVVWAARTVDATTPPDEAGLYVLRLDGAGTPLAAPARFAEPGLPDLLTAPRTTSVHPGEQLLAWLETFEDGDCAQYRIWDDQLTDSDPPSDILRCRRPLLPITRLEVAGHRPEEDPGIGGGGFVAALARTGPSDLGGGISIVRFDAGGINELFPIRVTETSPVAALGLAIDPVGRVLVAWLPASADDAELIHYRVIEPDQRHDEPLAGEERTVPLAAAAGSTLDAIALSGPGGGFVVGFRTPTPFPTIELPTAQRIAADGTPQGDAFYLGSGVFSGGLEFEDVGPRLAAGPGGRFGAIWTAPFPETGFDHLRVRTFAFDGRPASPTLEISLGAEPAVPGQGREVRSPDLAWDIRDGRLLAVWAEQDLTSLVPDPPSMALGQLLETNARLGRDELCILRGNVLSCSSLAFGPDPAGLEIAFGLGTAGGDDPLLWDFDGDGREDFCVRQRGAYRCDTAHDGLVGETQAYYFGGRLGTPVGADVDGDGREEVCLRAENQSNRFLCDTARNGAGAERFLAFGPRAAEPFLGDADGDGREELCLVIEGTLRCDTAQNGGGAELVLPLPATIASLFFVPGVRPFLADLDGDGTDQLCVATVPNFVCDVAGGAVTIPIPGGTREAGDVVLSGDVDGL